MRRLILKKQFEHEYAEEIKRGLCLEGGDTQWFFDDCLDGLYTCWLESKILAQKEEL